MTDDQIIEIRKGARTKDLKPFGDTIAFARAILESRELAGWMIVDKNGIECRTYPALKYAQFSDYVIGNSPDELVLEYIDREYSGMAPHSIRKIYF